MAMQAEGHAAEDELMEELIARTLRAPDESAAREAYRDGFNRLRSGIVLYPVSGGRASVVFESASGIATTLAAGCLPLGIAVAMHLYPLCVLQCMPLPLLSFARFQRAILLRAIRNRSLILANAGSERTRGGDPELVAREDPDGIRIEGAFEYMSLASVADIVLVKARLAGGGGMALCAADLRGDSVRIGDWRFSGSMRLSDTASVTFAGHLVPHGRFVIQQDPEVVRCASDYQRCWFHLLLADLYLARLERLHLVWGLRRSAEAILSLNELTQLRAYALRLLDDFSSGADVQPLRRATSAMKLRVSLMAQATVSSLRDEDGLPPAHAAQRKADASELGFIRFQPTADEIILRSIGVSVPAASAHP